MTPSRDVMQARRRISCTEWVRASLAALLCLCFAIWSLQPVTSHVPNILTVLQDHAEMIETHGHSHGLEEDIAWAMHGHSHDVADHDHSPAMLMRSPSVEVDAMVAEAEAPALPSWAAGPVYLHERPPRA
ncbi:hypothetical protein G0P98_25650 [Yangia sp. PrR004]|nr:hypothetical protein [Salipiger sp. PrR004]